MLLVNAFDGVFASPAPPAAAWGMAPSFALCVLLVLTKGWHGALTKTYHVISRRSQLQEDTYFRVLRMLQDNPDMTQREIVDKLGVSTSGLNYCLKALIDKGWVKVQNFSQSKNKFGYIYILTPTGIAKKSAITHRFLQRKMDEYEARKVEIEALKMDFGLNNEVPND